MSETPSESPSASNGAQPDTDQFWSREKVLYWRHNLFSLCQWPLAEACVLLLEGEDLLWVQMLMLKFPAREIASNEFKEKSILEDIGLTSPPAKPNPLQIERSRALEAIHSNHLPAKSDELHGYYVRPAAFLKWAKGATFKIPDEMFDEAKIQFSWEGMGYSPSQRLFIRNLFAQVLLNGEDFRAEESGRIKIGPLVKDMPNRDLWPDGMEINKDRRWWNELATDLLAVYHDILQQNRIM